MAAIFYITVYCVFGALLGLLFHVIRAVYNVYPDRISDDDWVNIIVSPGYDFSDRLFDLEFDKYTGYYKLFSVRNVRYCMVFGGITGFIVYCCFPDPEMENSLVDRLFASFADLFVYRLSNLTLF